MADITQNGIRRTDEGIVYMLIVPNATAFPTGTQHSIGDSLYFARRVTRDGYVVAVQG